MSNLLGWLVPAKWKAFYDPEDPSKPGWYNKKVTPLLQSVSERACIHPIRTATFFAVLASTMYIGLLETGLFEPTNIAAAGRIDFDALNTGARRLQLGPETAWKWQLEEPGVHKQPLENARSLSLITLHFGDSYSSHNSDLTPHAQSISLPTNIEIVTLPPSAKFLSLQADEAEVAYALPSDNVPTLLTAVKEIAASHVPTSQEDDGLEDESEQKKWIIKAAKGPARASSIQAWAMDSWTAFIDLVKNAETLDIVIMALGYLSMHLTFVSLFLSMRRLGSNFWLATTVLFSSAFAFLFGLVVTMKLGVPINVVLLSEGLPFLVVTVGFEKPIILTQAVLSAAVNPNRPNSAAELDSPIPSGDSPRSIPNAIQIAVQERGFGIVRDYAVEIIILTAGAASGIQGGLRQFCFLAAWTLFFDCILLFTLYTAILTIKLEINRIKRRVAIQKALEEDGVSRSVAESVASSNDWPKRNGSPTSEDAGVFGQRNRDSSIPRFKVLMVSGFIIVNVLNLCSLPFRGGAGHSSPVATTGLSSVVTQPPMDPFKVARNGLEHLYGQAIDQQQSLLVTVFRPVKYELQYPSVHYGQAKEAPWSIFDGEYADGVFSSMGGRVVEGLLKSFEDPVLSKWIIIALAMSLVLNGYLFNAARWSIKEPEQRVPAMQEPKGLGVAQTHRRVASRGSTNETHSNGHAVAPGQDQAEAIDGDPDVPVEKRSREACELMLKEKKATLLTDQELTDLSLRGKLPGYALEKTLGDKARAVKIRRSVVSRTPTTARITHLLERSKLPYEGYNYDLVHGACCENVIGYMPLPLGVAGPLTIDGRDYFLPMATTEGVLVASTSRGCKAINAGGGAVTVLTADGMTRGPCVGFQTLARAAAAKIWLDSDKGQKVMKEAFNSTSRFARLQQLKASLAGTYLYIRFKTTTGDAMGMNMISKGVENALQVMSTEGFEDMAIISVSGNFCTDKKPAAINWIDGRGKSVVAEAIIPGEVVRSVLKSNVDALVELNVAKNFIGSAMAGSIGGFNAHAANIVAAIFLATGQDPAQVVESCNCITVMKNLDGNLQISVSMPCIEVGTIGGGTVLEPQAAMLDLLGVRGPHAVNPGDNARQLAKVIAAGVLAGELSLCSALAAGHLVQAHMSHNRSAAPSVVPSRVPSPKPGSAPNTPVGLAMTATVENAAHRAR